ncbi:MULTISPECIES: acyl-CoA dehydrogenase family protein [Pseudomonas]|uniref:acyl-CoA dehydrogenase family protein n=1 Tax=Pseudomonas TaxID=286 RepID=UPI0005A9CBA3|nr:MULTISPECIES: acyl-CoA dehydrogenase family protein [Pseudomonas]AZD92889.1 Acyl-CoA dehydrogenase [Pseudomonas chlororaphis subsp. aureofaciens]AZD99335.1 Acyl-CoA dehydrogenase [Pseudomonas chlororaphis subsp. aureofaciens]AZE05519.1 Acyl-CoA dehydrogenase [Pseudomonas chlororaphis subsp. aureofaciens]KAB0532475.1 acyl-CoA dehydrogenase family protein [Pseudomonas chlororaphis subsp. aureofaciens]MBP5064375.1 acyl-CoA dehydrogenase family protein [Pseudomonas chlororaphis]
MTEHQVINPLSVGVDYEALAGRFRPIFSRIAAGAVAREQSRSLPYEAILWLKEAGFGAVRVPVEYGGGGASLPQLFQLLIELAEADSNVPQALRGHFAFAEDRLNAAPGPARDLWFKRFVDGDIVGCAWTEIGNVAIGDVITRVSPDGDKWRLNGEKFYSTGSTFSDWIDVYARRSDTGGDVIAAVRTRQPGIVQSDDWDGFGQRTTGSGTAHFVDAEVEAENLIDFATRFKYQTAFYQLVLLATLAGIGRAAVRDVAQEVRTRKRIYSHGNAPRVSEDAQVQQVVGEISALVYAAEASAVRAAQPAQQAYLARFAGNDEAERAANVAAEIQSATAQVVVTELIQRATSELFNALGASDIRQGKALDRHWRNARTVSSHNPVIYKARIVGDWAINGSEPPFVWQIGNGPERQ